MHFQWRKGDFKQLNNNCKCNTALNVTVPYSRFEQKKKKKSFNIFSTLFRKDTHEKCHAIVYMPIYANALSDNFWAKILGFKDIQNMNYYFIVIVTINNNQCNNYY